MQLVQQHIIKSSNVYFSELDKLTFLSKNLYNRALYLIKQHYFNALKDDSIKYKYLNYYAVNRLLKSANDVDYRALPANVSQEVLKLVDQNFKSFFNSRKNPKVVKARIPKYLDKTNGRQILIYNHNTLSKKYLDKGIIKIPKTDIEFKTDIKNIQQVRIINKGTYLVAEYVYNITEEQLKQDNKRYLSIDIGVNNLATCASNVANSFIINGRPVKSINQFYNKKSSFLKSELKLKNNKYSSKQLSKLSSKRYNKIKDYFHKASRYIINQAVNQSLNTVIIGHNKGWKQEVNIGKINNQNFVQIPFNIFINMLSYKAKLAGIKFKIIEEAYTSKCSFMDNEAITKHETYAGKRIQRGLFKTSDGLLVNADVNGSYNILRKGLKEASNALIMPTCRGFVVNPFKVKTLIN